MASSSTLRMWALLIGRWFGSGLWFRRWERREENRDACAARGIIFNFDFALNLPRHSQDEFYTEPRVCSCLESRRQSAAVVAHGHLIRVARAQFHRQRS